MASTYTPESQRLQEFAEGYRRRGYQVLLHPTSADVPEFLNGFQPDLIATSPEGSVIVEVKTVGTVEPGRWRRLSELVQQHPDWRLELSALDPQDSAPKIPLTESEIRRNLELASHEVKAGRNELALLIAWRVTEAAMRLAAAKFEVELPDDFSGTLATRLFMDGVMDREDYDLLMESLSQRNAVAHGYKREVTAEDVERLRAVAERILSE
jgi:hypothetical protein